MGPGVQKRGAGSWGGGEVGQQGQRAHRSRHKGPEPVFLEQQRARRQGCAHAWEMRSVRLRVRVRVRARCIWVREPEGCSGEKTEAPGWGGGQRGPAALAPP